MKDFASSAPAKNFAPAELPVWDPAFRPVRLCKVCAKPLTAGERKVHRGACARVRENQLQRLRRWRSRRWGPAEPPE